MCRCRDASGGVETSPEVAQWFIKEIDRGGRGGWQRREQKQLLKVRRACWENVLMCGCFYQHNAWVVMYPEWGCFVRHFLPASLQRGPGAPHCSSKSSLKAISWGRRKVLRKQRKAQQEWESKKCKKKNGEEVDCGRGQISMTIRFRERGLEIWSNSCWCPTGGDGWLDTIQLWSLTGPIIPTTAPCKSPPNIPPSPVVETLAVVLLRVNPAAAICIWEARGKVGNRGKSSNDGISEIWGRDLYLLSNCGSLAPCFGSLLFHLSACWCHICQETAEYGKEV